MQVIYLWTNSMKVIRKVQVKKNNKQISVSVLNN